jgi:DNA-binding XRE family transcriptional regulator
MEKTLFRPEYRILLGLVRQARRDAQITQDDLATRIQAPRSTITKWETGQQRMDLLEFWSYCQGIGANPIELLQRFQNALETESSLPRS